MDPTGFLPEKRPVVWWLKPDLYLLLYNLQPNFLDVSIFFTGLFFIHFQFHPLLLFSFSETQPQESQSKKIIGNVLNKHKPQKQHMYPSKSHSHKLLKRILM